MVLNKGGYVIINKAQDNVYELATSALTSGKPILWYDSNTECYYIDTISKSGTDIVLTKGGKTITIESDGDITEVGDVQNHLFRNVINLIGLEEDEENYYINLIIYDTKALTEDDFKELLKSYNSSVNALMCTGYDLTRTIAITNIYYNDNSEKYFYTDVNDDNFSIINITTFNNVVTQLF